ncbi:hypothetical protein XA68_12063 [Ophiocordyceps unilateralis]|uniref:Protein kinase domain-containing protein n=1 Tax=Ophiocordyceps unilateralis TaxID=268505 RepID=A0A2A9PEA7_OPHUN|nr:hypothetical protein XA68_12063 [Ophiocordyceps unilateralis]
MSEPQSPQELKRILQDLQEARQRAEEAEKAREEAEKAREELERQVRPSTLDEYITNCHVFLSSKFVIEPNKSLQSKGSITNPRNKWCPSTLKRWSNFIELQRHVFGLLYESYPADTRAFQSQVALVTTGERLSRLSRRTIGGEKRLEFFSHAIVEDPVQLIIDKLKLSEDTKNAFRLGNGITFEHDPHALSDVSEEVVGTEIPSTINVPTTPGHDIDLYQLRPDQICVYSSDEPNSKRKILYVSEYKAPHKLIAPHLRIGLRDMNIYTEVVSRKTKPTKDFEDERSQYDADLLTASAITETYHYMILSGLEYGLLTTGEVIVFLHIDWDEPETLLYHLAEPSEEWKANRTHPHLCTAVGQYLAFSLIALGSTIHGQDERERAKANLNTWEVDFEATLHKIPEDERRACKSSAGFKPVNYEGVDRSPYPLRWKKQKPTPEPSARELFRNRREPPDDDDDDDDNEEGPPDTPSPAERGSGAGTRRSQRVLALRSRGGGGQGGTQGGTQGGSQRGSQQNHCTKEPEHCTKELEYCTQKCLLGLVRGRLLDTACPNAALHVKKVSKRARHALDQAQFLDLLWKQMKRTLDGGITPLSEGGARGVLFKVTLLAYGYTFVAKGTVKAFIKHLEHEAAVYERLRSLQGVHVPVFLGAIDLRSMSRIYYFDHRVYVIHMMFLSWGGPVICLDGLEKAAVRPFYEKADQSLEAVHGAGVLHNDVRTANVLWNAEVNGVFIIDFERAVLLDQQPRPLAPLAPSKGNRKMTSVDSDGMKLADRRTRRELERELYNELCTMTSIFYLHFIELAFEGVLGRNEDFFLVPGRSPFHYAAQSSAGGGVDATPRVRRVSSVLGARKGE